MSTYLSCFIVSDFTHTETSFQSDGKPIPLKVYASPENLNKTSYAGYVGQKAIEYYIKYFNFPYPLPKLGKFFYQKYVRLIFDIKIFTVQEKIMKIREIIPVV